MSQVEENSEEKTGKKLSSETSDSDQMDETGEKSGNEGRRQNKFSPAIEQIFSFYFMGEFFTARKEVGLENVEMN